MVSTGGTRVAAVLLWSLVIKVLNVYSLSAEQTKVQRYLTTSICENKNLLRKFSSNECRENDWIRKSPIGNLLKKLKKVTIIKSR